jgi:hypothetical protein
MTRWCSSSWEKAALMNSCLIDGEGKKFFQVCDPSPSRVEDVAGPRSWAKQVPKGVSEKLRYQPIALLGHCGSCLRKQ